MGFAQTLLTARARMEETRTWSKRLSALAAARASTSAAAIVVVPQDLRTADPSFVSELADGDIGLAAHVVAVGDGDPFNRPDAPAAWNRSLFRFTWLRHFRGEDREGPSAQQARQLVGQFLRRHRDASALRAGLAYGRDGSWAARVVWHPAVAARRLIAWLSHADLLLTAAEPRHYDDVMAHIDSTYRSLLGHLTTAPESLERLRVLVSAWFASVCLAEQRAVRADLEALVEIELRRQVLADGVHVSRHPGALLETVLDLIALRACYVSRELKEPAILNASVQNMIHALRALRLGDGGLARFHGMGPTWPDRVAAALAYDKAPAEPGAQLASARFSRLAAGRTTVIVDHGPPPPLAHARRAHASALALEMSVSHQLLFVNHAADANPESPWANIVRATAAHNTLVIERTSSSRLVQDTSADARATDRDAHGSGRGLGGLSALPRAVGPHASPLPPAIAGPAQVEGRVHEGRFEEVVFVGHHDGYAERFRLVHERRVTVSADGRNVYGHDILRTLESVARARPGEKPPPVGHHLTTGASGALLDLTRETGVSTIAVGGTSGADVMARAANAPRGGGPQFAVHFHLHPDIAVARTTDPNTVRLTLRDGQPLTFRAAGATLSIEESVFLGEWSGPFQSLQLVLRGAIEATPQQDQIIEWRLEHTGATAHNPSRTKRQTPQVLGGDVRGDD